MSTRMLASGVNARISPSHPAKTSQATNVDHECPATAGQRESRKAPQQTHHQDEQWTTDQQRHGDHHRARLASEDVLHPRVPALLWSC
jgi:hypothetical protein